MVRGACVSNETVPQRQYNGTKRISPFFLLFKTPIRTCTQADRHLQSKEQDQQTCNGDTDQQQRIHSRIPPAGSSTVKDKDSNHYHTSSAVLPLLLPPEARSHPRRSPRRTHHSQDNCTIKSWRCLAQQPTSGLRTSSTHCWCCIDSESTPSQRFTTIHPGSGRDQWRCAGIRHCSYTCGCAR